jgi:cytochrome c oxidase subunit IV
MKTTEPGSKRPSFHSAIRLVALWSVLAVVSLLLHILIETTIRGYVQWQLVFGNVFTIPTLIVIAQLVRDRSDANRKA